VVLVRCKRLLDPLLQHCIASRGIARKAPGLCQRSRDLASPVVLYQGEILTPSLENCPLEDCISVRIQRSNRHIMRTYA
jgi:hypothetical protein